MRGLILGGVVLLASLPATSNYKLNSYGFGSGGGTSQTATYSLEGISGETNGSNSLTANDIVKPGFVQTQQANVPKISLDNDSGQDYNRLHFVIDPQNNPTDATYLIAVSTDNFASNISYLKPDGTLTGTLSATYYQSYSAWGGAAGSYILGLQAATAYYAKALATQGKFTQSPYGPVAGPVSTVSPTLTFNLVTSNQASPPFTISLGTLTAGNIATSAQTINTTITTNGLSGGDVYVKGQYGGLFSSANNYTIGGTSGDLGSLSQGFGAQSSGVSQTAGGPLTIVSPYSGSGNNVGAITNSLSSLYTSTSPVIGGSATLLLKAKTNTMTVASSDYQEVLTFTAAGNF